MAALRDCLKQAGALSEYDADRLGRTLSNDAAMVEARRLLEEAGQYRSMIEQEVRRQGGDPGERFVLPSAGEAGDEVTGRPAPESVIGTQEPGAAPLGVAPPGPSADMPVESIAERLGREEPDAPVAELIARARDAGDAGDRLDLVDAITRGRARQAREPVERPGQAAPMGEAGAPKPLLDELLPRGDVMSSRRQVRDSFETEYRQVPVGELRVGVQRVSTAEEAAHVLGAMRKHGDEAVAALVLDQDNNILRVIRHSQGSAEFSPVFPARLVAAVASDPRARKFWIAHNHPSGDPAPSPGDAMITDRVEGLLDGVGLELAGHVVLGRGAKAWDLRGGRAIEISPRQRPRRVPVTESMVRRLPEGERVAITDSTLAHNFVSKLDTRNGLVLLDTGNRPVGVLALSAEEMAALRAGAGRRVLEAIARTNASGAIVLGESAESVGNLARFLSRYGAGDAGNLRVLDAIDTSGAQRFGVGGLGLQQSSGTFFSNPFGLALRQAARTVAAGPGASAAGGFAGATGAAIFGTDEDTTLFGPRWWLNVAAGGIAGAAGFAALRQARLLGKGSFTAEAFERLSDRVNRSAWLGRGPEDVVQLKRKQRVLRELMDRQTGDIGAELLQRFSPDERVQIADIIEGRGITGASARVLAQAKALDEFLTDAGQRLKDLGMLAQDQPLGGYLHRYYAKHLGLGQAFKEARGQTLSGTYSLRRGTTEDFDERYLSPGARAVAEELGGLMQERSRAFQRLRVLEAARPPEGQGDMWTSATQEAMRELESRVSELDRDIRRAREVPLVEMTGLEDGLPKSFFYTSDEAAASPGGGAGLQASDRAWTIDHARGSEVRLHRDWTEAERESWGEIRDAGYRYVRGMAEVSHDLALATLYQAVARNREWVRPADIDPGAGWIRVPDANVPGGRMKRYGALAGQYVRDDVWGGLRHYGRSMRVLGALGEKLVPGTGATVEQVYRGALSRWKAWHTVYNPVTHLNNTLSNLVMLQLAGYNNRDLLRAVNELRLGERSAVWREARDAGLFGTTWSDSLARDLEGGAGTLGQLAEQMIKEPENGAVALDALMRLKEAWIESAAAVKAANGPWKTSLELARAAARPVGAAGRGALRPIRAAARASQHLYGLEDDLFKMAAFVAERRRGTPVDQSVTQAERFFFDYLDLPSAVKFVRDFPIGSPFISYTWKAVPAVVRTVIENPEKALAAVALLEAVNYAGMLTEGMPADRYWETMYGRTDDKGLEVPGEQGLLPQWDSGRVLWGGLNTVHIPGMPGYMLSLANALPAGNPFAGESGNRALSLDIPGLKGYLGSDLLGSNPIRAVLDVGVLNEDWKGKQIYSPEAPTEEKIRRAVAYLYRAWAPSNALTPGGWHQSKILEGLAQDAAEAPDGLAASVVDWANRFSESIGMGQYTGLDAMGNEASTQEAVAGSFGVKLRAFRPQQSAQYQKWSGSSRARELGKWWAARKRELARNRITAEQFRQAQDYYVRQKQAIEDETARGPLAGAAALIEQGRGGPRVPPQP